MIWPESVGAGVLAGILGVGAFTFVLVFLRVLIRTELPDKILVITGRKKREGGRTFGFSVERGRTVRVPYFQSVSTLDLGVFPINVRVEGVNSANGITVGADATACVCIDDDDKGMLYSAVERLMGKDRTQIQAQIQQTLVGNFRGALNKATPLAAIGMDEAWREEEVDAAPGTAVAVPGVQGGPPAVPGSPGPGSQGERALFRSELLKDINSDLSSFGMRVVSVSLQKIWDTSNYIANLAQKTLARKRQQVEIEEARLRALAEQSESDSRRRIEVAKNKANELIIAARQRLEVYRRESQAQIDQARLEADSAVEEAKNRAERSVQEKLVELQALKNQTGVTLEASARTQAAEIVASAEREAVRIREETRNVILEQKVRILKEAGDAGRVVLFLQQQLPRLFEAFRQQAQGMQVDSLVVMDEARGFNGAVNRGPAAFVDFLKQFHDALGIDVRELVTPEEGRP